MRTAKEMRDFAAQYNVVHDYVSAVKLASCPFEAVEAALLPGERVCFCFGALPERAVAATNMRLIQAEHRNPGHDQTGDVRIIHYDTISSIFSMNMLLHIRVNGLAKDLIYGNLTIDRIQEVAEILGDLARSYEAAQPSEGDNG